jgi:hypothetical protein
LLLPNAERRKQLPLGAAAREQAVERGRLAVPRLASHVRGSPKSAMATTRLLIEALTGWTVPPVSALPR